MLDYKSKFSEKIQLKFLAVLYFSYKLLMPDKWLIALIFLKRKVRALQGHSAR